MRRSYRRGEKTRFINWRKRNYIRIEIIILRQASPVVITIIYNDAASSSFFAAAKDTLCILTSGRSLVQCKAAPYRCDAISKKKKKKNY